MDYLNQISADTRPAKKQGGLFDSLPVPANLIKILIGAIVAVFLIAILGAGLSNQKDPERDLIDRINQRSTNLMGTINIYNPQIKSSRLRAISNNISSVLVYTQSKTAGFIQTYYADSEKDGGVNQALIDEETAYIQDINSSLETARIQATLDRDYHRVLTRETSYLISLETELINRTKKSDVAEALKESSENLDSLYRQLYEFTDPTL